LDDNELEENLHRQIQKRMKPSGGSKSPEGWD